MSYPVSGYTALRGEAYDPLKIFKLFLHAVHPDVGYGRGAFGADKFAMDPAAHRVWPTRLAGLLDQCHPDAY